MRPSAKTGEAENVPLSRCCQWIAPVAGVEARGDAGVGHEVQLVADEQRRRRQRRAAPQRPADMRLRHVASAVGPDGDDRRLEESGGDVDEPVAVDRPRHVREAVPVADAPDFLARLPDRRPRRETRRRSRPDRDRRRESRAASCTPDPTADGATSSSVSCRCACRARRRTPRRCRRS